MRYLSVKASLIVVFFYSLAISIQEHIYIFMFLPILFMVFINISALKNVIKKLLFLNIFIGIVAVSLFIQQDVHTACLIFVRSNLIILAVLLLFNGKNEFDIAIGFWQLYFPRKLISIIFFTAKFIFLIRREFELFKKTLHIRGFKPRTNLLSYKVLSGFVGILIIKTFKHSRYLQNSMIIRGFNGEIYSLKEHNLINIYDKLLMLITFTSLILRIGVII